MIGEGEKDEAPMLYNGEEVGDGHPPEVDVAVDPLEGTTLTARGAPNAIAVIAVAERGTMFFPGAAVYMDKIAAGAEIADAIDLDASPGGEHGRRGEGQGRASRATSRSSSSTATRNEELIAALRDCGAKVNLITDGDVAPAIAAANPQRPVDLMMGIGGTPEGVIAAAAVKCLGGAVQGRLWPRNDEERQALVEAGYDVDKVLTTDDLVSGDDVFMAATGVTDGALLDGVRYTPDGAVTDSIVMRSRSGTVRRVQAWHELEKLSRFSGPRVLGRDRLLHVGRVAPRPRRAVEPRAMHVRSLRRRDVLRLAGPRLERGRLERAAVRERQLPRMRPERVHRVQVRGRVLVGLAAGEEHDPRHRRPGRGGRSTPSSPARPPRRRPATKPRSPRAPCSA